MVREHRRERPTWVEYSRKDNRFFLTELKDILQHNNQTMRDNLGADYIVVFVGTWDDAYNYIKEHEYILDKQ